MQNLPYKNARYYCLRARLSFPTHMAGHTTLSNKKYKHTHTGHRYQGRDRRFPPTPGGRSRELQNRLARRRPGKAQALLAPGNARGAIDGDVLRARSKHKSAQGQEEDEEEKTTATTTTTKWKNARVVGGIDRAARCDGRRVVDGRRGRGRLGDSQP